jgi:hypothetical protein
MDEELRRFPPPPPPPPPSPSTNIQFSTPYHIKLKAAIHINKCDNIAISSLWCVWNFREPGKPLSRISFSWNKHRNNKVLTVSFSQHNSNINYNSLFQSDCIHSQHFIDSLSLFLHISTDVFMNIFSVSVWMWVCVLIFSSSNTTNRFNVVWESWYF